MSTWLLTGGAGYIGAHVLRALRAAGHDAVVLDDLSTGPPRAPARRRRAAAHEPARPGPARGADRSRRTARRRRGGAPRREEVGARVGRGSRCTTTSTTSVAPSRCCGPRPRRGSGGSCTPRARRSTARPARTRSPRTTRRCRRARTARPSSRGSGRCAATPRRGAALGGAAVLQRGRGRVAGAGRPGRDEPAAAGDAGGGGRASRWRSSATTGRRRTGPALRDYVHVEDLAEAHVAAAEVLLDDAAPSPGALNVGRNEATSVLEVVGRRRAGAGAPGASPDRAAPPGRPGPRRRRRVADRGRARLARAPRCGSDGHVNGFGRRNDRIRSHER